MPFTADEFHDLIRKQAFAGVKPAPVRILECAYCGGTGSTDCGETTVTCAMCAGRGRIATEGGEV